MPRLRSNRALLTAALVAAAGLAATVTRSLAEGDSSADRATVADGWIYEDIDAAYAKAAETGKPLLVAFR